MGGARDHRDVRDVQRARARGADPARGRRARVPDLLVVQQASGATDAQEAGAGVRVEVRWVEMRRGLTFERRAEYPTERKAARRARDLRRAGKPADVLVAMRMWHGGAEAWEA